MLVSNLNGFWAKAGKGVSGERMMDISEMEQNANKASDLLKVMANQSRLMILCNLLDGEKSVQQLQTHVGLSQSALSQQLAILRGQSLVRTRREAQNVFYSLASPEAETVIGTLYQIYCAPNEANSVKAALS